MPVADAGGGVRVQPLTIDVSPAVLDDLRERLARSRFVTPSGGTPWAGGTDPDYLRDLVAYWLDGFDWPAQQARLESFPQFTADIDGHALHFVHVRAVGPAAHGTLPVLLVHGWPSSIVEMLPLAERLSDPARFGGDPATARDVVIPSLPGFLWSELPDGALSREAMARPLHPLMTRVLGYERYLAFGGDLGGVAAGWLAALHPESVAGLLMIHPPFPASFDDARLTPAEQAFLDAEEAYDATDGGYSAILITRPDTVGAALIDSPVGLLAWIVDKYRDWSDCDGDLERRFDRDTLLTVATLYWITGSIGTSFRQYFDYAHGTARPSIDVPAAFLLSHEPGLAGFPRTIAERACSDIRSWSDPARGGHFMAFEEPDQVAAALQLLAAELR